MTALAYRTADVDGLKVFYREAGPASAPTLLLLHGFPSSSHMFRDLIPLLADRYHLVAPDLPGFGRSDAPPRDRFAYSFDHLAEVIDRFTEVIGLSVSRSMSSTMARRLAGGSPASIRSASAPSSRRTAMPMRRD